MERARPIPPWRALALGALLAVLPGCGETPAPDAAAATAPGEAVEADGPLTVYCGRAAELMSPLLERFERESGTALDVRWGESAALAAALASEGTATPADVFVSARATPLGGLSRKGLLRELPAELVRGVPAHFAGSEPRHDWVGLSGRARAVLYDPVATAPTQLPRTLEELGEPRYRGRFGLAPDHPSFQAQMAAYRVLRGEEALDELLARLHANAPRLYGSEGDVARAVADGEIGWGLVDHVLASGVEAAGGASRLARHFMPGDGARFVDVAGVGVLSEDPRALDLVRFLLGEEAQQHFAEQAHEYPLLEGAPPVPGLPALATLRGPRVDFADVAAVLDETQSAMRRHGLGG